MFVLKLEPLIVIEAPTGPLAGEKLAIDGFWPEQTAVTNDRGQHIRIRGSRINKNKISFGVQPRPVVESSSEAT